MITHKIFEMPVVTRSQHKKNTNTNIHPKQDMTPPKQDITPPKQDKKVNKIYHDCVFDKPYPRVTFLTQEEYNIAGYTTGEYGGYIEKFLIAACIPKIHNSIDDDIAYEAHVEKGYIKPDDKIYVVAPKGYCWVSRKCYMIGYMFFLERIN